MEYPSTWWGIPCARSLCVFRGPGASFVMFAIPVASRCFDSIPSCLFCLYIPEGTDSILIVGQGAHQCVYRIDVCNAWIRRGRGACVSAVLGCVIFMFVRWVFSFLWYTSQVSPSFYFCHKSWFHMDFSYFPRFRFGGSS